MERPPGARTVAGRLRQLRTQRGLTAQQLADLCAQAGMPSLSRVKISKIESGVRKAVTADEAAVLARVLGVPIADLLAPEYPVAPHESARVNPFQIPGWLPMRPLCPWREPSHRDYYVDIDGAEQAFKEFVAEMEDVTPILHYGRTVLITGDPGCGKSALANRCVDWLSQRLSDQDWICEIIDLTAVLLGRRELSIEHRVSLVCDQLVAKLIPRGLLRPDSVADLLPDRDQPWRVYPLLADALLDRTALVILLPSIDLVDEVLRYAALTDGRILFVIESAMLNPEQVSDIVRSLESWVPSVALRVGPLRPGDVRRFVSDRLDRHLASGVYPRVSQETMDAVEPAVESIAQLQRIFYGVFEDRRRRGEYSDDSWITYADIMEFVRERFAPEWGGGGGGGG
ncbi:helix-turn-helix domain-containing protein, partial [Actinophytocola sp.]|uniref:helix-turn-helix domain-containing protein n=1 Tax=Actinophytocola sp. TaxID=1872138 RepID=UPI002DDD82FF